MNAEERFRRKMAVLNSARQRELYRDECLAEVMASLAGTPHEELARRIGGPTDSPRILKGGRTYTVDVTVYADETPGVLHVVFSVDDAGLWMDPPKTTSRFVSPNENLTI
jgi:hypothetical protein